MFIFAFVPKLHTNTFYIQRQAMYGLYTNKKNSNKFHTVGTVTNSNRKLVEEAKSIP